ncbi:DUF3782 domain-containing protein [uncultured Thiodictyon sp.]|uniref:DUF3782 domain-containing protein n=1 Tax=uncultured Thiodictyon sp. TaxID=1846217 RepID=UPI0025D5FBA6|nr:DUF3782 domain-containing protein [uncultured Thiodictyon sp.]
MTATSEEVWALLRELAQAQKQAQQEAERRAQEAERRAQESARKAQETEHKTQETDRQLKELGKLTKELGKQIGGLGEKFGSFTEGLALPSMERLLRERFGMEVVSPSVRVTKGGRHLEIDVLAYANGPVNAAYVVEVKSHLREEGITQLRDLLQRFREFLPEHRDKRLYGILAAVDLTPALRERVLREGFYVARIQDQVFTLDVPEGFQPRGY